MISKYLCRFDPASLEALSQVVEKLGAKLVRAMVEHELSHRGWFPIFVDSTAIEVYGKNFEGGGAGLFISVTHGGCIRSPFTSWPKVF